MLPVHLPVTGTTGSASTERDANLLLDALWAHAAERDGLEHARVRAAGGGLDVVLFVRAGTDAEAQTKARSLLTHVLTSIPACQYSIATTSLGV